VAQVSIAAVVSCPAIIIVIRSSLWCGGSGFRVQGAGVKVQGEGPSCLALKVGHGWRDAHLIHVCIYIYIVFIYIYTYMFRVPRSSSSSGRPSGSGLRGVRGFRIRFRVWGVRLSGLGFSVQGAGLRAQGSGFRVQGAESMCVVPRDHHRHQVVSLPSRVQGAGFRDQG
jgi:hypothetical protein